MPTDDVEHGQQFTTCQPDRQPDRQHTPQPLTPSHSPTSTGAHPAGHTHDSPPTCDEVGHEQQLTTCEPNRQHTPQLLTPSHPATPSAAHPAGHIHDSQPTCNEVGHEEQPITCQLDRQRTPQPLMPSPTTPLNSISPCGPEGFIPTANSDNVVAWHHLNLTLGLTS